MKLSLRKTKKKKGQTALEYALVVGAISLVIMAAWNQFGKKVRESIAGTITNEVVDHLEKGNGTISQ